jgi:asparagine synthase (glutamine-hydrolysing)
VPLAEWFRGPLREEVRETLFAENSAVCANLDRALLRQAWDDFLAGAWDGARALYSLWLYEAWHRGLRS